MIVGIGVDLVEIDRMRRILDRHGRRARRRFFTDRELSDCDGRADPAEGLAARLAAKEAAFKALGTGKIEGHRWGDAEVATVDSGRPTLVFSGAAGARAAELGVERTWVSLSHEAGVAAAVVVLEAGVGSAAG